MLWSGVGPWYIFMSLLLYCSVMSNSLWPHGLQHARLSFLPSLFPRVCSNSCPLSHSTSLSSVIPFSSCPQSFQASGSFSMNQVFSSLCRSIGASASASLLPVNIQGWFPLGLTGLILQSKGLSGVFSNTSVHSSALSLPYGAFTSVAQDDWKKHSFD